MKRVVEKTGKKERYWELLVKETYRSALTHVLRKRGRISLALIINSKCSNLWNMHYYRIERSLDKELIRRYVSKLVQSDPSN